MPEDRGRLALIVNSASYDRVSFALNVATAAAAVGRPVNLLFGYGGLIRLKKGSTDVIGEETDAWIRERIQSAFEKGGVPPISRLLDTLLKLGGKVYVCPAAMALHNLIRGELIEQVEEVCSLNEFMDRERETASTIMYV